MAYKAKKTEHSGSKQGCGAYWGRKRDAKRESTRRRRRGAQKLLEVGSPRDPTLTITRRAPEPEGRGVTWCGSS